MTDLDIIILIGRHVVTYVEQDAQKHKREIQALLKLKRDVESAIEASLNHQAQREMQPR